MGTISDFETVLTLLSKSSNYFLPMDAIDTETEVGATVVGVCEVTLCVLNDCALAVALRRATECLAERLSGTRNLVVMVAAV